MIVVLIVVVIVIVAMRVSNFDNHLRTRHWYQRCEE